ncbi:hypothetical protein EVAR_4923_1 [Eumeta japonica]|uniref:Uncharacterized protein n=1 Tax=Eumeta variegata TaxID=151549 RepID=A0A4C1XYT1_EUMVA|nr:hypothetical protein EVAR_4923_1 [Eumeta japonica]
MYGQCSLSARRKRKRCVAVLITSTWWIAVGRFRDKREIGKGFAASDRVLSGGRSEVDSVASDREVSDSNLIAGELAGEFMT